MVAEGQWGLPVAATSRHVVPMCGLWTSACEQEQQRQHRTREDHQVRQQRRRTDLHTLEEVCNELEEIQAQHTTAEMVNKVESKWAQRTIDQLYDAALRSYLAACQDHMVL